MGEHLSNRPPRDQMNDAFMDYIVQSEGRGDGREAIRNLIDRVSSLHEHILRVRLGPPPPDFLARKLSTIEHSVICTECPRCLHRTAQPPDIVKSFYKDREVTLRAWAASQRRRCGQIGVGVALRDTLLPASAPS